LYCKLNLQFLCQAKPDIVIVTLTKIKQIHSLVINRGQLKNKEKHLKRSFNYFYD